MFSDLGEKLNAALGKLTGRGTLSEEAVDEGLQEIRRAFLEADVSFQVVRDFTERIRPKAVGVARVKSVSPGQQLVKLVHEELVELLGRKTERIEFKSVGPTVIMLVGLQGSGKTTTAGKLASRLKREQKAPFLVAADVYRPAAEEQLRVLGEKIGVPVYGGKAGGRETGRGEGREVGRPDVVGLIKDALREAESARARTVIIDTAGRLQIDDEMMAEVRAIKEAINPSEVLLVADGMTGQDAVRIAQGFHDAVGVTGVVLTKLDGDARGGAALSVFGVTGAPIKYVGVGEGLDALEPFHPDRMAGRILQQGDVIGLVEKAQLAVDEEAAAQLDKKARSKRGMDLNDFLLAMKQMEKLGPLESIAGLLPGVNRKMMQQLKGGDKRLKHVEAIVLSMTPAERANPKVLNGSRKLRVAKGAGRTVVEVNRLLKNFEGMRKMMKRFGGSGMKGLGATNTMKGMM